MKAGWLIAALLIGSICVLPWTGDPRVALVDWSPPLGMTSYVELASRFGPWKRSALGLGCGLDHQLRLVFRSRLPGPREFFRQGSTGKATILVQGVGHGLGFEVPITLTDTGVVESIMSERLDPSRIESLKELFEPSKPETVYMGTLEMGTDMIGRADSAAIQRVVSSCA